MCFDVSIRRCASLACAKGKVANMTGRTLPAARRGQIFRRYGIGDRGFLRDGPGSQRRPGEGQPFGENRGDIHLGSRPAQQRNDDHPSFERREVQIARDIGACDHVENDVDAFAARFCPHHLDEVFRSIVDSPKGAELFACPGLVVDPAVAKTPGAPGGRQLYGHGPDAAGAAVNQHRFSPPCICRDRRDWSTR